ncbi:MAG: heme-binding protein [Gammaproteobacteria bacterium]
MAAARLTLAAANTVCTVAVKAARAHGFAPLCVVVLDAGGHLLALQREEQAGNARAAIAIAKASGCLGMGFGGRELERRAAAMPGFFAALAVLVPGGMVPLPGGVLLHDSAGGIIGAVGASGDTSENDELCVLAGVVEAGLIADSGR